MRLGLFYHVTRRNNGASAFMGDLPRRSRAPPSCALQLSGWVEEEGATEGLHRATDLLASVFPSSWSCGLAVCLGGEL